MWQEKNNTTKVLGRDKSIQLIAKDRQLLEL